MPEINIVPYSKAFLDESWSWLSDPEIKQLTATPDMTREAQLEWYKGLPNRSDYRVWGIALAKDNTPIGVVGLKNVIEDSGEFFGYIGVKQFWNQGLSKPMLEFIIAHGRSTGLKYITLKVLEVNTRAIKAYKKFGFKELHNEGDFLFMSISLL